MLHSKFLYFYEKNFTVRALKMPMLKMTRKNTQVKVEK